MKRALIAALACLALGGCMAMPTVSPAVEAMVPIFDAAEHEPYKVAGTGSLKGQAFLRQQGGGVVTCAGAEVVLLPATYYYRAIVAHMRASGHMPSVEPGAQGLARRSQCDAQGNFSFNGLPAGNYIVGTDVRWTVGYQQQGGPLMRDVSITNGSEAQVLLTDTDRM